MYFGEIFHNRVLGQLPGFYIFFLTSEEIELKTHKANFLFIGYFFMYLKNNKKFWQIAWLYRFW